MNEMIPYQDVQNMAMAIAKSQLFGVKTPEQALALMLISQAEGRHPALAARDYDIIQGRPAKKAEAMLRDFLESGGKVEWHKLDDTAADATFSHPAGGTLRIEWSMARANAAGLGTRDMWKKYPRQMLRSRVVSEGIRSVCPMATSGMYVPEEVADIVKEKEIKGEVINKDTGEIKKELEGHKPYDTAAFAKNLPAWTKLIKDGTKTAEAIIKTVSSKAVLSDEQKATINAIKKDEAPAVTFESVYGKLEKSDAIDVLDLAADLISGVADEQQKKDLTQFYLTRKAGFEHGAQA